MFCTLNRFLIKICTGWFSSAMILFFTFIFLFIVNERKSSIQKDKCYRMSL
uniref:Uncharacterized protein n=1 Tax=Anguilla anguilla TaxID=7936 RepID=A0A0E9QRU3_ANGAN